MKPRWSISPPAESIRAAFRAFRMELDTAPTRPTGSSIAPISASSHPGRAMQSLFTNARRGAAAEAAPTLQAFANPKLASSSISFTEG